MPIDLQKHDDQCWVIPREGRMRVPGRIYASESMIADLRNDKSLQQVQNVAQLPGIVRCSIAMPDIHWGYGFPIGGVAAFDEHEGVISPGGVGYDINCGVRLLRTNVDVEDVRPRLEAVSLALHRAIPAGLGSRSHIRLGKGELDAVLREGARWAIERGFGQDDDLAHIEEHGCMPGADPKLVSEKAKERGRPQLGSLGSGNHFCELGYVAEIFDEQAARMFGLALGEVTLMLHSGSRGLGHQICDEALRDMLRTSERYGIELSDRQLCAAPLSSPEAAQYFAAMACAVNFAFANRQMMTGFVREAFSQFFGSTSEQLGLRLVYDVCHNIAKWETHDIEGRRHRVCVHRKGATRAFGPHHPDVPADYRDIGQPVIVPGDMGRYSFVLRGTERAMQETFGSSCHGAGRRLSRAAAKKQARGRAIFQELQAKGVFVQSDSKLTVAEEMPEAYKDVAEVVDVMDAAGIAKKVAKLVPMAVIKG